MLAEIYYGLKVLGAVIGLSSSPDHPKPDTVTVERQVVRTDMSDTLECDCAFAFMKDIKTGNESVALRDLCGKRSRLHYTLVLKSARRLSITGWQEYNASNRPEYMTKPHKDGDRLRLAPIELGGDALKSDSLGWLTYEVPEKCDDVTTYTEDGSVTERYCMRQTFTFHPDYGEKVVLRDWVKKTGKRPWVTVQTFGCTSPLVVTDTIVKPKVRHLERK